MVSLKYEARKLVASALTAVTLFSSFSFAVSADGVDEPYIANQPVASFRELSLDKNYFPESSKDYYTSSYESARSSARLSFAFDCPIMLVLDDTKCDTHTNENIARVSFEIENDFLSDMDFVVRSKDVDGNEQTESKKIGNLLFDLDYNYVSGFKTLVGSVPVKYNSNLNNYIVATNYSFGDVSSDEIKTTLNYNNPWADNDISAVDVLMFAILKDRCPLTYSELSSAYAIVDETNSDRRISLPRSQILEKYAEFFDNSKYYINIEYNDGYTTRIPVRSDIETSRSNQVWTHRYLSYERITAGDIVLSLADAKTISNKDFYELDTALKHAVNEDGYLPTKYYVDVDSPNDIVLPIEGLSADTTLTRTTIGDDIVYNTPAAVEFNTTENDYSTADQIGRVFSINNDGYITHATENSMSPLFNAMARKGVYEAKYDGTAFYIDQHSSGDYPVLAYNESLDRAAIYTPYFFNGNYLYADNPIGYPYGSKISFYDVPNEVIEQVMDSSDYNNPVKINGVYPYDDDPIYVTDSDGNTIKAKDTLLSVFDNGFVVEPSDVIGFIDGVDKKTLKDSRPINLSNWATYIAFDDMATFDWLSKITKYVEIHTSDGDVLQPTAGNIMYSVFTSDYKFKFFVTMTDGSERVYTDFPSLQRDLSLDRNAFDKFLGISFEDVSFCYYPVISDSLFFDNLIKFTSSYRYVDNEYKKVSFINWEKSSIPDINSKIVTDKLVKDTIQYEESLGYPYITFTYTEDNVVHEGCAQLSLISDKAVKSDRPSKTDTYYDDAIHIDTSDVPSAKKGITYDVTNQIEYPLSEGMDIGGVYHRANYEYETYDDGSLVYEEQHAINDSFGRDMVPAPMVKNVIDVDDIYITPDISFVNGTKIISANMFGDRDNYESGVTGSLYNKYVYSLHGTEPLGFTEYKWGELVFASKPDAVDDLTFDQTDYDLTWKRPVDEGFGVNDDGTSRSDDYIYLQTYRVDLYNDKNEKVLSKSFDAGSEKDISYALQDVVEPKKEYHVDVFTTNVLGSRKASLDFVPQERIYKVDIEMTADKSTYNKDEVVTYTETVENVGNMLLTGVKVTQSIAGEYVAKDGLVIKNDYVMLPDLEPGDLFTFEFKSNANNAGDNLKIVNKATVTTTQKATDDAEVTVYVYDPNVNVVKQSDKAVYREGDTIVFTDIVTNTGNHDLTNIIVKEDVDGTYSSMEGVVIDNTTPSQAVITKLAPQQSIKLIYTTTTDKVPHDSIDVTSFVNVTTAEGSSAEANVAFKIVNLGISVSTVSNKDMYTAKDTIIFTDKVKNTGNYKLTNVLVTESILGGKIGFTSDQLEDGNTLTIAQLNPGEEVSLVYAVPVANATIKNDHIQSYVTAANDDVSDRADRDLFVVNYVIGASKTSDKTSYYYGDEVVFTDTITNKGNYTLTNIKITESLDGNFEIPEGLVLITDGILIPRLEPNDSISFRHVVVANTQNVVDNKLTDVVTAVAYEESASAMADAMVDVTTKAQPSIDVTKTLVNKGKVFTTSTVSYVDTVENTGNVDLTNVVVSENLNGILAMNDDKNDTNKIVIPKLSVGEKVTLNFTTNVFDNNYVDKLLVSTVDAVSDQGVTDEATVSVHVYDPTIKVTATADAEQHNIGEDVVFTATILNEGDCDLTNVKFTTSLENGSWDLSSVKTILRLGESFDVKYTVEGVKEIGTIVFDIDVSADEPTTDNASVKTLFVDPTKHPTVTVDKSSDKKSYNKGEKMTFTDIVKNTGDVDLTNVVVSENLDGEFENGFTTLVIPELKINEEVTLKYLVDSSKIDTSKLNNEIESIVNVDSNEGATATDHCTVTLVDKQPEIAVTKTSDKKSYDKGDIIAFTDVVKNTGNMPLHNVIVKENLVGKFDGADSDTFVIDQLAVGESKTLVYKVPSDKIETKLLENVITSVVDVSSDEGAKAQAILDVTVLDKIYKLGVKKSAVKKSYVSGDTAQFEDVVTNTGNSTLHNLVLTEDKEGVFSLSDFASVNGKTATISQLLPGESIRLTYNISTKNFVGTLKSTVNVVCDEDPTGEATASTLVEERITTPDKPDLPTDPVIIAKKISDKPEYDMGDVMIFTDTITNPGDVTLHNVVVTENLDGTFDPHDGVTVDKNKVIIKELKPGEKIELIYKVPTDNIPVTEVVTDVTSRVTVTSDETPPYEDELIIKLHNELPNVIVKKTSDKPEYDIGDIMIFTDVVTNTGNITLHNVVVTENLDGTFDPHDGVTIDKNRVIIKELKPGEKIELTYKVPTDSIPVTEVVTDVTSRVTVTSDETPPYEDELIIELNNKLPDVIVKKTSDKPEYDVGDVMVFTDVVTNMGNITLHNVVVTENLDGTFDPHDGLTIEGNKVIIKEMKPGEKIKLIYRVPTEGIPVIDVTTDVTSKVTVISDETSPYEDELIIKLNNKLPNVIANKTSDKPEYNMGEVMVFTDVVTNTGNITLHNVVVTENLDGTFDPHDGVTIEGNKVIIKEMKPGEKIELIYRVPTDNIPVTEVVTDVTSRVTVTSDETPPYEDELIIKLHNELPNVIVKKTSDKPEYDIGDIMIFTDVVTNIGNITLHNVVVTENLDGIFDPHDGVTIEGSKVIIKEMKPGEKIDLVYRVSTDKLDLSEGKNTIDSTVVVTCDEGLSYMDTLTVVINKFVNTPDQPTPSKPTPSTPVKTTPSTPVKTTPSTPTTTITVTPSEPVKTGDNRGVFVIAGICIVSGILAIVLGKKKKDEDDA